MTDGDRPGTPLRGRRARWAAAAVLGPPAALTFAGLTAWAAANPPPPAPVTLTPQPAGPAAQAADLQQSVDDTAQQVVELGRTVTALRVEAQAMTQAAGRARAAAAAAGAAVPARAGGARPAAGLPAAPRAARRVVVVRQAPPRTSAVARTSGS